ncbi:hypothetical protein [Lentisalinibacter orientalis]|uniref:hypothetical protein n=1 Tax=Lentisalinibacter orientalis TaxID=2992241 RepID=UPI0038691A7F
MVTFREAIQALARSERGRHPPQACPDGQSRGRHEQHATPDPTSGQTDGPRSLRGRPDAGRLRLYLVEQQLRQPQQQLRQPEFEHRQPEQRLHRLALRLDERIPFRIDGQQHRLSGRWFAERIHRRDARRYAR